MNIQLKDPGLLKDSAWINGSRFEAADTFAVLDPSNQEVVTRVGNCGADAAEAAIVAAEAAFDNWRSMSQSDRFRFIARWADLIEDNADDLAMIVCSESGKRVAEAQGEISQCAALLRWFIRCAEQLDAPLAANAPGAGDKRVVREPVGVVACITPWNFPAAAVIVKAGAALAAGCTAIVKPSEETPLIALAFAELSARAEMPKGIFNVVTCLDARPVGAALCGSEVVQMLSFTGSTAVGRQLYAACGDTIKRLALELGGNAPFIVFDDADLEAAVAAAIGARFYNSGQICVGANRFLVQHSIYDRFAALLSSAVGRLSLGDGRDPASDVGPMINQAAIDRLGSVVASAVEMGATCLTGGKVQSVDSWFFEPTVLSGMTPDMPAYRREIFGPVACLYEFTDDEAALQMANDTSAGLSSYVFSENDERLMRFGTALESGVVGINTANIFSNDMPFGGIKQSGIGREHGAACLDEYLEVKSVFRGP